MEAGFYFDPSPDHDDNVTCYLCLKSLDGWEAGDDPVAEHIRHSESCGWAVTAATQDIPPSQHGSDPHSEQFRQARLMTFGRDRWPHGDGDNLSIANVRPLPLGSITTPLTVATDGQCWLPLCAHQERGGLLPVPVLWRFVGQFRA